MSVEFLSPATAALRQLPPGGASSGTTAKPALVSSSPDSRFAPASALSNEGPAPDAEAVRQAIEQLNAAARQANRELNFDYDPGSNHVIIRVIDRDNAQVVYQIPSDEALRLASSLKELSGILFDRKV